MGSDSSPTIVRRPDGAGAVNSDGAAARQSSASGAASVDRPSVKLRGACNEDPVAVGNVGDVGPAEGRSPLRRILGRDLSAMSLPRRRRAPPELAAHNSTVESVRHRGRFDDRRASGNHTPGGQGMYAVPVVG